LTQLMYLKICRLGLTHIQTALFWRLTVILHNCDRSSQMLGVG
jgi:hypothetical protein